MNDAKIVYKVTWPPPGRYVVAVSGGVDSAVLLDLLMTHPQAQQWELVPAHFNHGWPGDDAYEKTARQAIERYGMRPVVGQGKVKRSEEAARVARYGWLRQVAAEHRVAAILTAHQWDDVEETVLLNMLRGTGRQGLSPFERMPDIVRPLLAIGKAEIKDYAAKRGLIWCHDTYNDDLQFRRNVVRHKLIPALEAQVPKFHERMAEIVHEAGHLNRQIDTELATMFTVTGGQVLVRQTVARGLDLTTLTELIVTMANAAQPGAHLSRQTVWQLAIDLKTGRFHRRRKLSGSLFARPTHDTVAIVFDP